MKVRRDGPLPYEAVRPDGFEPPTRYLKGSCSAYLSYGRRDILIAFRLRFLTCHDRASFLLTRSLSAVSVRCLGGELRIADRAIRSLLHTSSGAQHHRVANPDFQPPVAEPTVSRPRQDSNPQFYGLEHRCLSSWLRRRCSGGIRTHDIHIMSMEP
jgi:hypothetical protein